MKRRKHGPPAALVGIVAVLGLILGLGGAWIFLAPPGPLELHFVGGPPVSSFEREGHQLRIYLVSGDVDSVAARAQAELKESQGWQPPTFRSKSPEVVQITRVKSPRGDFQFVRVLIEEESPGKVRVTLDEGPIQKNAFQK